MGGSRTDHFNLYHAANNISVSKRRSLSNTQQEQIAAGLVAYLVLYFALSVSYEVTGYPMSILTRRTCSLVRNRV